MRKRRESIYRIARSLEEKLANIKTSRMKKEIEDWWADLPALGGRELKKRRTGYPTQKPTIKEILKE